MNPFLLGPSLTYPPNLRHIPVQLFEISWTQPDGQTKRLGERITSSYPNIKEECECIRDQSFSKRRWSRTQKPSVAPPNLTCWHLSVLPGGRERDGSLSTPPPASLCLLSSVIWNHPSDSKPYVNHKRVRENTITGIQCKPWPVPRDNRTSSFKPACCYFSTAVIPSIEKISEPERFSRIKHWTRPFNKAKIDLNDQSIIIIKQQAA